MLLLFTLCCCFVAPQGDDAEKDRVLADAKARLAVRGRGEDLIKCQTWSRKATEIQNNKEAKRLDAVAKGNKKQQVSMKAKSSPEPVPDEEVLTAAEMLEHIDASKLTSTFQIAKRNTALWTRHTKSNRAHANEPPRRSSSAPPPAPPPRRPAPYAPPASPRRHPPSRPAAGP